MTQTKVNPKMPYQRKIVARRRRRGRTYRGHWLVRLACAHEVIMHGDRGERALSTHCEKCSLGLVRA